VEDRSGPLPTKGGTSVGSRARSGGRGDVRVRSVGPVALTRLRRALEEAVTSDRVLTRQIDLITYASDASFYRRS